MGHSNKTLRVEVKPQLLRWACERAELDPHVLARRIPKLSDWEQGKIKPTLKQIEKFAKMVHTPIGFLFMQTPPNVQLPIPDLRTTGNKHIGHPSPSLLDTIFTCQQRQEWYVDFARSMGETAHPYVGTAKLSDNVVSVAARIRNILKIDIEARRQLKTWEEALRQLIEQADKSGILVMVNGVVGSNNHRKLNPSEFRGFALSNKLAPLIFINGSDTKSGQMFTLAHELVHIWLDETGVSDVEPVSSPANNVEKWCDQVAAEILVPIDRFKEEYRCSNNIVEEVTKLARIFKVSTLVILRRIHDAGGLSNKEFWKVYNEELDRLLEITRRSGGNFYLTQAARVSKRFAIALVTSTLAGQTLYRDAFHLLGFSKHSTFRELGDRLGVA